MPPLEVRHFTSSSGRDVIAAFLDTLPVKAAAKCLVMMERLGSGDIHLYLRSGIWERRVPHGGEQDRFLYFVEGAVEHILAPVHKKARKLDEQDIRLAEQRRTAVLSSRRTP